MKDLFGDIVERAMDRLKEFEPTEGYYVAYSGGKDSDVVLDLVRRSGVKYDAHHHLTTCDPPEVVWHVRAQRDVQIHRPERTMWQLIRHKKQPPLRQTRYCCHYQKEPGGDGRLVLTGVRWDESHRRSQRKMVEQCYHSAHKRYLHPIIDWSTVDVWQYIRSRKLSYCRLYDEGFTRLGCVLCPMSKDTELHLCRWPRLCRAWERAIKATYDYANEQHPRVWANADEYWQWWLDRDAKAVSNDMPLFFKD